MSDYGTSWGEPKRVRDFVARHAGAYLRPDQVTGVDPAVASKTLSALAREGAVDRVRKGLYYVPRPTLVGPSRPTKPATSEAVLRGKSRPTGLTAVARLGLTTQVPAVEERAVMGSVVPVGTDAIAVKVRRTGGRTALPEGDGALLETLRTRARDAETSPEDTATTLVALLSPATRRPIDVRRLRDAALAEPPRVRAMVGALLETAGWPTGTTRPLRKSLNPISRFDFGPLAVLPNARAWQAK